MDTFEAQVSQGQRFEFGNNWRSFLSVLTDHRIKVAENSLRDMLAVENLKGKRFLDIGSGSGLFSLAARNLGASVHSFDFDPASVACAQELRARYFPGDPRWVIQQGSVLDEAFLKSLGAFDIVYSWGVLHHTGDMWMAIANAASLVTKDGTLMIAIYNDVGVQSRIYQKVKMAYCSGPLGHALVCGFFIPYFFFRTVVSCVVHRRNAFNFEGKRGMSVLHDWIDWLGGFPYEFASVRSIFLFLQDRGFTLKNIKTTNTLGNNQFIFGKAQGAPTDTATAVREKVVLPPRQSVGAGRIFL
jgi:2-polyprenyl-3-methyl-5-hydroxy-6-metoxy-1,4-benzoquinol methylase